MTSTAVSFVVVAVFTVQMVAISVLQHTPQPSDHNIGNHLAHPCVGASPNTR